MTWTKLSDDFGDETWTLSDPAFRLLVEMLNYSNRKLLDLKISKDELRRFAKHPEAVTELVAGGWAADQGDHYQVIFHGLYQPTRADVLKRQEANRKNGLKGGRPVKPSRERAPVTQSLTQSLTQDGTHRDGTGRDKEAPHFENETELVDEQTGELVQAEKPKLDWPVAPIPNSDPGYCAACGGPLPCTREHTKTESARAASAWASMGVGR